MIQEEAHGRSVTLCLMKRGIHRNDAVISKLFGVLDLHAQMDGIRKQMSTGVSAQSITHLISRSESQESVLSIDGLSSNK